jgi:hypothetical protein
MDVCDVTSIDQRFTYTSDLTLVLVSSMTTANPRGMCLDVATPQLLSAVVRFQSCLAPSALPAVRARQMWSINTSSNFEGTNNGLTLNDLCFNVQNPDVPGSLVILGSRLVGARCGGGYDNRQSFSPEATVGAGAAGIGNRQLVNYSQFGRCLDVTEQNINFQYMISWPCKQEPNPANLDWNQLWTTPVVPVGAPNSLPGEISVQPSTGGPYCLRSPGSPDPAWHVVLQACPGSGIVAHLQWTVYRDTGDYATSYRIVDYEGYCLQPTDPDAVPPDLYPSGYLISKLVVAVCSSSTLQKWNAPPGLLDGIPVKDIYEE